MNHALNEANALQKRIDELEAKRQPRAEACPKLKALYEECLTLVRVTREKAEDAGALADDVYKVMCNEKCVRDKIVVEHNIDIEAQQRILKKSMEAILTPHNSACVLTTTQY